jgi:hypothetical protein
VPLEKSSSIKALCEFDGLDFITWFGLLDLWHWLHMNVFLLRCVGVSLLDNFFLG